MHDEPAQHHERREIVQHVADVDAEPSERSREPHRNARHARADIFAAIRSDQTSRCPFVNLTRQMVQYRVLRASRRAKLSQDGVHILRHTFCSHLAMQGAPPRAIQELAGHRELGVTQRYMHLSPAALDSAIRLLDQPSVLQSLETWGRRDDPRRKDQLLEQFNWR
jgi:integrase